MLFVISANFYVSISQLLRNNQLNCKFKRLTNSPEWMTLLSKIMLKIVGKSFFTPKHAGACQ